MRRTERPLKITQSDNLLYHKFLYLSMVKRINRLHKIGMGQIEMTV